MEKSSVKKVTLGAAAVGVGAGLGVLLAPKSGKETRKDLNDKIHQLLDKIKNIDSKELKNEIKNKINEIEAELNELDKEKVLEIARDKADKVKNKTDELVELAKQAGSKAANKTASELREKAIDVTKKVLNKLENK